MGAVVGTSVDGWVTGGGDGAAVTVGAGAVVGAGAAGGAAQALNNTTDARADNALHRTLGV
ncbi:MAG: hypothetical protein HC853_09610 [Anaerolineae bacterium]|nr:hypothetical protein [Anaerolineae bacterium]